MSGSVSAPGYRPDIDGLRAVAVLSVVLYHLEKAWLPGGYVGVDIFFVISGYLITRNIWGEMSAGRFSFADFYLRRIRRIAPAFLVVTAATLVAGAFLLLPEDLLALGKSALWGVFSASNVFFWLHLDTSYFAETADQVPLLHTWSLGVEEQFYFLWPSVLFLAACFVPKQRRMAAVAIAAVICVVSFVIGEMTNVSAPKFSYYMLPARAGELMIGALLALWAPSRNDGDGKGVNAMAEAAGIAGLGFLGWSLFALNDSSPFPGINALWPCLGAALLMLAGGLGSRIVRLLLTPRLMVFVGLISYSLYLWHWPILAFLRYFRGEVDGVWRIGAVVAMFLAAYASYRWVELPARYWRTGRLRQAIALYGAPGAAVAAACAVIIFTGGLRPMIESLPGYRMQRENLEAWTAPANDSVSYICIQSDSADPNLLEDPRCLTGDLKANGGKPDVLLWGDSLAAAYTGAVSVFAKEQHVLVRNAEHSACPTIFGDIEYGEPRFYPTCVKFRALMQPHVLSSGYRVVVLAGGWAQYDKHAPFRADLRRTIDTMTAAGLKVVIIGQMPWIPNYNRECAARNARIGSTSCQARMTTPDQGAMDIERYLAEIARTDPNVTYLPTRNAVCKAGTCSPFIDGHPVYYDRTHLSIAGSWAVGRALQALPERTAWAAALTQAKSPQTPVVATAKADANFQPRLLPAVLGGYHPGFPYHVRSEKGLDATKGPSAAMLEYWGASEQDVLTSIERDMGKLGFARVSRRASGASTRLDFEKTGQPRVSFNVGPLGALQAQAPDVAGVVYVRW